MNRITALLVAALMLPLPSEARDLSVRSEFRRNHPCPSTGKARGACQGWQVDHIVPLCRGGSDTAANMQWLSVEQHKMKTRGDCRGLPGL